MIVHYIGSETSWGIWSFDQTGALRNLAAGTFTGWLYVDGAEAAGVDLTGSFAGAAGAGVEPSGTPNLTYTPAANEALTAGEWKLRVRWSNGDTVVFDGPITVRAQVA